MASFPSEIGGFEVIYTINLLFSSSEARGERGENDTQAHINCILAGRSYKITAEMNIDETKH